MYLWGPTIRERKISDYDFLPRKTTRPFEKVEMIRPQFVDMSLAALSLLDCVSYVVA
jgi:hypothetical protein